MSHEYRWISGSTYKTGSSRFRDRSERLTHSVTKIPACSKIVFTDVLVKEVVFVWGIIPNVWVFFAGYSTHVLWENSDAEALCWSRPH